MPKTRRLLSNWSKGELSPKLEGRPDLAAYFEGAATAENVLLLRQGGMERRVGTRFIAEAKVSSTDVLLLPFEVDVNTAYVVEAGVGYLRFFKNKAAVMTGGNPVEVTTPYTESDLRNLHTTQSVDVLFLFHRRYSQRTLSRISDTSWLLSPVVYNPPPSFEVDTDISEGTSTVSPPNTDPGSGVLVSIIAPLAGNVSGDTTVTVSIRPGVGVTSVRVSKNAVPFGPIMTVFPYSFIWGTNQEFDLTTFTLTAELIDSLGNVSTSAGVIVTVNQGTPPVDPGTGGDGGGGGAE